LGIGPNPQSPIPNPQSPIPNPHVEANKIRVEKNNYFKKIIKLKIINELIENYKGYADNESVINDIEKIEEQNKTEIKEYLNQLNEIIPDLKEYELNEKNICEIYIDIIMGLIKNNKLSDYEYASNIMTQLDMENIEMNYYMSDKFLNEFNLNEEYINKYKIKTIEDLYQEETINFHYILLKFILKDSFYIYNIYFLLHTRKNIIRIMKSNYNASKMLFGNFHLTEKIKYILVRYLDSEYYINIFLKDNSHYNKENNINIISKKKNNVETAFQSNKLKSEINYLNEQENKIILMLLNECTIIFQINKKEKEPFIIYEKITIGKTKDLINFNDLEKIKNNYQNKEESILYNNFIKFLNILKTFEIRLKNEFTYDFCLKIKLEIANISNQIKDFIYNLKCIYIFYDPINNTEFAYNDNDILKKGTNSNLPGFNCMLSDIKNKIYEKISIKVQEYSIPNNNNILMNNNENCSSIEKSKKLNNNLKEELFGLSASKEEILKFNKTIYKHKNSAESIFELSNGLYISVGYENYLIIYDERLNKQNEVQNIEECIYNIFEKKNDNSFIAELIVCCSQYIYIILINKNDNYKYTIKKNKLSNLFCFFCCDLGNNNYIVSGENNVGIYTNLLDSNYKKKYNYINKAYRSGIIINDKVVALISNSVLPNGEDSLIFCDVDQKKIIQKFNGYSFISKANGLVKISYEKDNELLLCACKKYTLSQKNGILQIDLSLQENNKYKEYFYDTDNFEVYCFCQIKHIVNDNINLDSIDENYKNNISINNTNYFFIGGFDTQKGEGKIKLYQVIDDNKNKQIEFLQDIEFEYNEEFEGFQNPVTSIIQSTILGNILVTCMDGNVFLFSTPNIDYYLDEEN
jgi:hypothetical protein